jgi:hypothetical protein
MKNILQAITLILVVISCNKNQKKTEIEYKTTLHKVMEKIEISEFDSSPKNYDLFSYRCVSFEVKKTKSIEYTYQKGILKNKKIIKTIDKIIDFNKILKDIPKKYLDVDQVFGQPNSTDDGGIRVLIFIKNDQKITWTLDYNEKLYPNEIKILIDEYYNLKNSLK